MDRYKLFYKEYLGIDNDFNYTSVHISEFRERLLNRQYLYPVVFTEIDNKVICSTSSKYYDLCTNSFSEDKESINAVYEHISSQGKFSLREMYRYSVDDDPFIYESIAMTLSNEILRSLEFDLSSSVEHYIKLRSEVLEHGRQFAILESNKITSTAFISDIYGSGCNIVVFTKPEHRGKGYGNQVVKACVNWCLQRELIPLYLVEKNNLASIALAESIGLVRKSCEWVITDLNRD